MITGLWTRPGEELIAVTNAAAGDCANTDCGKPLTEGMFRWANLDPDPADLFGGDGRFPALRHSDGTDNCQMFMHTHPQCPECGGEKLSYQDTGYGTTALCSCGWREYTDRGN